MMLVAEVQELTPVFAAIQRGSKRSRLRLTAAVCPKNHVVAEVFRGSDGDLYVIYALGGLLSERVTYAEPLGRRLPGRGQSVGPGDIVVLALGARCRCSDVWSIEHREFEEAITAGRRRFVVSR